MKNQRSYDSATGSSEWLLALSAMTQLCVVTDASVGDAAMRAFMQEFSGVAEVAMLRIDAPEVAHREWLASVASDRAATGTSTPLIAASLQRVSRAVRLVVWSDRPDALDWLGGVHGHIVSHIHYNDDRQAGLGIQREIEQVDAVFRQVVRQNFADYL
jgi:hypothetical protein